MLPSQRQFSTLVDNKEFFEILSKLTQRYKCETGQTLRVALECQTATDRRQLRGGFSERQSSRSETDLRHKTHTGTHFCGLVGAHEASAPPTPCQPDVSDFTLVQHRQVSCAALYRQNLKTRSHTLKPLEEGGKEKATECFLFHKQKFQVLTRR